MNQQQQKSVCQQNLTSDLFCNIHCTTLPGRMCLVKRASCTSSNVTSNMTFFHIIHSFICFPSMDAFAFETLLCNTLCRFLLVFLFNGCRATFPFEGTVVLVDNLVDSPAYPLNCTTFGQTGKCNFRSATWACQSINDICNFLLPPNESVFLIQDVRYGNTYDPDLPLNVSIVYRNANTYANA